MAGSELLILNPRHRRRRARRHKARVRTNRRRRPSHHAVFSRLRRRARRAHRRLTTNPRRHTRRRRSNPRGGFGRGFMGIPVNQIVAVTLGGAVTEVLADKLAGFLPASWKADVNVVRIGTKAAIGIGVPLLARKFLPKGWGAAIALGGGVVTLLDILKTYVAPMIPGITLSGYEIGPTGLSTATIAPGGGLGTFIQGAGSGLSGSAYDEGVWGPIV